MSACERPDDRGVLAEESLHVLVLSDSNSRKIRTGKVREEVANPRTYKSCAPRGFRWALLIDQINFFVFAPVFRKTPHPYCDKFRPFSENATPLQRWDWLTARRGPRQLRGSGRGVVDLPKRRLSD
ncbi:hypothetical protein AOLI_G00102660 [Acnodon oligacanthus]